MKGGNGEAAGPFRCEARSAAPQGPAGPRL